MNLGRKISFAMAIYLLLSTCVCLAGTWTDDFNDGDIDGWEQRDLAVQGNPPNWFVEDGELVFEPGKPSSLRTGDEAWKDYVVEVDVTITKHKLPGQATESVGIGVRGTDNGYYLFTLGTFMGAKCIYAARFVGLIPLIHNKLQKPWDWEVDELYHLKVEAEGDRFKFYIDDELGLEYRDGVYKNGQVGVGGAWINTHARFDNFKVTWDESDKAKAVDPQDKLAITWGKVKHI